MATITIQCWNCDAKNSVKQPARGEPGFNHPCKECGARISVTAPTVPSKCEHCGFVAQLDSDEPTIFECPRCHRKNATGGREVNPGISGGLT